jgi:hypothetical protein
MVIASTIIVHRHLAARPEAKVSSAEMEVFFHDQVTISPIRGSPAEPSAFMISVSPTSTLSPPG